MFREGCGLIVKNRNTPGEQGEINRVKDCPTRADLPPDCCQGRDARCVEEDEKQVGESSDGSVKSCFHCPEGGKGDFLFGGSGGDILDNANVDSKRVADTADDSKQSFRDGRKRLLNGIPKGKGLLFVKSFTSMTE